MSFEGTRRQQPDASTPAGRTLLLAAWLLLPVVDMSVTSVLRRLPRHAACQGRRASTGGHSGCDITSPLQ